MPSASTPTSLPVPSSSHSASQTSPVLNALLTGVVDYAGLFPPEKLPLPEALSAYESYLRHEWESAIARFVLPTSHFAPAAPLLAASFAEVRAGRLAPWTFSALFKAHDTLASSHAALPTELAAVRSFLADHPGVARVDAIEIALPPEAWQGRVAEVGARLAEWVDAFRAALPDAVVHFEIPWTVRYETGFEAMKGYVPLARAKFRTGGVDPSTIPSVDALAAGLDAVTRAGIPVKFTAGLHEPLRHFETKVGAHLHGFLNVFLAAWMLASGTIDQARARAVLACEDASAFRLVQDGIAFVGAGVEAVTLSVEEVRHGRACVATSFGTCSFLEPLEGLRALGWMG